MRSRKKGNCIRAEVVEWQTRRTQNPLRDDLVRVQVPPSAPSRKSSAKRGAFSALRRRSGQCARLRSFFGNKQKGCTILPLGGKTDEGNVNSVSPLNYEAPYTALSPTPQLRVPPPSATPNTNYAIYTAVLRLFFWVCRRSGQCSRLRLYNTKSIYSSYTLLLLRARGFVFFTGFAFTVSS